MSELTYEKNPDGVLETYEWDNVWWHKNKDKEHPRIMTLGDSITYGTREVWNNIEGIEWYIDNCATSKAVDNPYLLPLALMFYTQTVGCDALLVNNGLHGWHLTTAEYKEHYKKLLTELKANINVPIAVMTTTCVSDEKRNALVIERNAAALEIAKELSLPVIDLYTLSTELTHTDGVHINKEGMLSVCEFIRCELHKLLG